MRVEPLLRESKAVMVPLCPLKFAAGPPVGQSQTVTFS